MSCGYVDYKSRPQSCIVWEGSVTRDGFSGDSLDQPTPAAGAESSPSQGCQRFSELRLFAKSGGSPQDVSKPVGG
jgi:hypothetical protein